MAEVSELNSTAIGQKDKMETYHIHAVIDEKIF